MPRIGYLDSRLAPTEHPSLLDIVWSAGLYEGEGNCSSASQRKDKVYHSEKVVFYQKDPWILYRLKALFGGSISWVKPNRHNSYGGYRWNINGARARGFLMTIYKFQSPRRKEQIGKCLLHLNDKN